MSSPEDAPTSPPQDLTAADVVNYLRHHPDFLVSNGDLLAALPTRFEGGKVVDFQQFVITRLKDELDALRGCADDLVQTTRQNLSIQTRTHQAVVTLIAADTIEDLCRAVAEDLPPLLDVDVAALGVEPGIIPPAAPMARLGDGDVARLLGNRETVLRDHIHGDPRLYGEMATLVRSEALALLDLGDGLPPAVLALGARGPETFQSSQGTELLTFLAVVLGHCVRRWVTVAP